MWAGVVIREHVSPKRHAELVSASIVPRRPMFSADKWTLNQVQGDGRGGDGKKFTQRRGDRRAALPHNVMLEPKACSAQLVSASIVPHRPKFSADKWTLEP